MDWAMFTAIWALCRSSGLKRMMPMTHITPTQHPEDISSPHSTNHRHIICGS
ncbi:unnamed protein product [Strongylus vulgaris]|uniref:Uncharacterized protein n=1 Tax=Strongylus vulgaris TaxID=40348 RepID=A0A3P7IGD7_STRVU|nr:unnamed protein product [Strongylus vulgaris]